MIRKKYKPNHGFTLFEMVLVIFLIGLAASSLVVVLGGVDDQARYEETARRHERILNAILGRSGLELNGSPVVSGFIADMGAMPESIDDLTKNDDISSNYGASENYGLIAGDGDFATASGNVLLRHGWRGPYLTSISPEKDAWGGDFQFSWDATVPAFLFYSRGKDRADGGSDLDSDYPSTGSAISDNIYQVTQGILNLTFVNNTGVDDELVLGILYPGLDITDEINELSTNGADFHDSIILPRNTDTSAFIATGNSDSDSEPVAVITTASIDIPTEFPASGLVRKFQLIVYDDDGSPTDELQARGRVLHDKIYYLLPQVDAQLDATIILNP